jgi:hypothetical protein
MSGVAPFHLTVDDTGQGLITYDSTNTEVWQTILPTNVGQLMTSLGVRTEHAPNDVHSTA